jgi:hypothetical protein
MVHPIVAWYGVGAVEVLVLLLILVVMAIPAILASVVLARVPPAHRKQSPGLAFLLLIPLFGFFWAFFVHPRVAASLKSYFDAKGDTTVGDCGHSLAVGICVCSVCSIIPVLGLLIGLGALVLLIIFYIQAFELSGRVHWDA